MGAYWDDENQRETYHVVDAYAGQKKGLVQAEGQCIVLVSWIFRDWYECDWLATELDAFEAHCRRIGYELRKQPAHG